ncbi:MAG: pimeloyl-ACP methyl ester carboxylesterase [Candidatus Poriferisodalaceae bacterium]|jgi:pimeloyl-ACP methyl ester carboxylesterase
MSDNMQSIRVVANGLDFHVRELQPTKGGSGQDDTKMALLLHGFPELAHSWRHQMEPLAELGYRVWAPDQRGYGETRPRPGRVSEYAMERLLEDVTALIDASGASEVLLVGHDWGAAVAWMYAMHGARPINRLVIMNVPHPACFQRELKTFRQLRKSWYILAFQIPWLPEKMLTAKRCEAIGRAFTDMAVHQERFTEGDLQPYKDAACEPDAAKAMVNWYRAVLRGARRLRKLPTPTIEVPTLMIWGLQDTALDARTTDGTADHVSDLTLRFLPNSSHWVQQDTPDEVNEMLVAFLAGVEVPGQKSR